MTAILIVSDRDARSLANLGVIVQPYVTIVQNEADEMDGTVSEWDDPGYRVTCSADGGTCTRGGLGETEYPLADLIAHAEVHVENHERGAT